MSLAKHTLALLWVVAGCGAGVVEDEAADQQPPRPAGRSMPLPAAGSRSARNAAPAIVAADAPPAQAKGSGQMIFESRMLHEIEFQVDAQYLPALANISETRVPCTMTINGVKMEKVGLRKKGFLGSRSATKPSYSVKFDEFVPGQEFDGLDKVLLNNAKQDPSFLNEPLIYEFFRWSGLVAPRTSYAVVTQNGVVLGLYVVKEAIDKAFLSHHFGDEYKNGNVYEGEKVDFARDPMGMDLKNEKGELRKRDIVIAASQLIQTATNDEFEQKVSTKVDLQQFITSYAIEAIFGHWDNYSYSAHNYYIYENPRDGRIVMIPHGADWLFSPQDSWPTVRPGPREDPFVAVAKWKPNDVGLVSQRVRDIPAMDAKFRQEIERLIGQVWDIPRMHGFMDAAAQTIRTKRAGASSQQLVADFTNFEQSLPIWKDLVVKRRAYVEGLVRRHATRVHSRRERTHAGDRPAARKSPAGP